MDLGLVVLLRGNDEKTIEQIVGHTVRRHLVRATETQISQVEGAISRKDGFYLNPNHQITGPNICNVLIAAQFSME